MKLDSGVTLPSLGFGQPNLTDSWFDDFEEPTA